ncbi:hypothetical protein [Methylogaea oryzae]|uniref:hypothetical protein n=1 Tax=Methylogaea oryzae TaxID=1295382 RepID=UPI0035716E0A
MCAASTAICWIRSTKSCSAAATPICWAAASSAKPASISTSKSTWRRRYICGEESALIESLEGKRGNPRNRPPFPVTHGYLQQPTVVNNVETFAATTLIALHGGAWYQAIGTEKSAGTKLLSVSGDCERPGIYEYPFGVTVAQVLEDCGARDTQLPR